MAAVIATYPQRKIETSFEIQAPADKFYKVFKSEAFHVPKHAPTHIQIVDLHEGDWESHGSVKLWKYVIGGKTEIFKVKIELDDEKRKITLVGVDGDVMKYYTNYKAVFQVTPKGTGSLASVAIAYEKLKEDVPAPDHYLEFMVELTKKIYESLVKT